MSEPARTSALVIRTSSPGWLINLAKAYKSKTSVTLLDDAQIGVDPINETLLDMGRKGKLSPREWVGVIVALGVGGFGAWLVVMAVLDPEPYSKIGLAIGAGTLMTLGGGFAAIRILTGHKPPSVGLSPGGGFRISFD
jgi:hypothetical protein